MVNVAKPVNNVEKIMVNTQRISLENNIYAIENQDIKSSEINADTNRHRFKRDDLDSAIENLNKFIQGKDSRLEFKVHERTGRFMVKFIDRETDEIIREIPPEKILDLVASIWDAVGILVDERG